MNNYKTFSQYLKKRFNCRVYKISVDAGFSCPNLDGTLSRSGCIYCDNSAFSPNVSKKLTIEEQIAKGIVYGRKRFRAEKFIIYFQAYTNTNLPAEQLREKYRVINKFEDIAGISIGTRPDCVDQGKLDVIAEMAEDYEVWIEYGLQSIHDKTLRAINRNHTFKDFLKAFHLTKERGIKTCLHTIIGLPGEDNRDIIETAKECGNLAPAGIKIHPLYIVRGTALEKMFLDKRYTPLQFERYVEITAEFISNLHPETVIQRITADCPARLLAAPDWINRKDKIIQAIKKNLTQKKKKNNFD